MRRDTFIVFGPHAAAKREQARAYRLGPTPAEKLLWERLRRNQVAGLPFRRQQVIEGFIVDFYCHAARLAIEVDGEVHRERRGYDEERDRILAGVGVRTLRFTNEQVLGGMEQVVAEIARAVAD